MPRLHHSPSHRPIGLAVMAILLAGVTLARAVAAPPNPNPTARAAALARHWNAEHRVDPGRHHFDILDGLETPDSPLMDCLLT